MLTDSQSTFVRRSAAGLLGLLVSILFLAAGCSPMKVLVDYDKAADFRRYNTFDYLANRPNLPGVTFADEAAASFAWDVLGAVSSALEEKGLARDEVDPDLLVVHYAGADGSVDVEARGYRYGRNYGEWGGPIDILDYHEDTLIVDFVDARTMELVWRAAARGVWYEDATPSESKTRIDEAVVKMLASYPPSP